MPNATPEERRTWEQACLTLVEISVRESSVLAEDRTIVYELGLRGSYPDTELYVDLERRLGRAEITWALWGTEFGTPSERVSYLPPEHVQQLVMSEIYEFQ